VTSPKEISNTDLVVLATMIAGGGTDFCDIEDIAVAAYRLSPQRFGWRTKSFPSDKLVVQAIADLERHHKNRLTLRGADKVATRMLTAEGRKAAIAIAERVAEMPFADADAVIKHFHSADGASRTTPAEKRRVQSDLTELHRHRVFQKWSDEEGSLAQAERWELLDALTCLPDASDRTIQDQIEQMVVQAEKWGDQDVLDFLAATKKVLFSEARGVGGGR
jgi:hypothetical protein